MEQEVRKCEGLAKDLLQEREREVREASQPEVWSGRVEASDLAG